MNGEIEKAPVPQDPDKPVKMLVVQPPEGIDHIYANTINVSITGYDVAIWLSKVIRLPQYSPSEEPTNQVETRASVTLSWSAAKALRNVLSGLIEKFEKINGEIDPTPKIPPKLTD